MLQYTKRNTAGYDLRIQYCLRSCLNHVFLLSKVYFTSLKLHSFLTILLFCYKYTAYIVNIDRDTGHIYTWPLYSE